MSHSTAKPKCPGCHQEVVPKSEGQCVVCLSCSKKKRRVFNFCWDCQREWPRQKSPNSTCTLTNCALRAALLADGRISDRKSSAMGCPYFRACPKCNALLTHTGQGCPNIECPKCSTRFCFRCLRPRCLPIDFMAHALFWHRQMFPEVEQCTIVDNSQSLISL